MKTDEFVKQINSLRLQNKNKWYTYQGTVNNKTVALKGYGTWLQGSLSDGYVFTPLPKHLQNNEPIVPMTSNLDGGKYVKPKKQ